MSLVDPGADGGLEFTDVKPMNHENNDRPRSIGSEVEPVYALMHDCGLFSGAVTDKGGATFSVGRR